MSIDIEELAIKHGAIGYNKGDFDEHYLMTKADLLDFAKAYQKATFDDYCKQLSEPVAKLALENSALQKRIAVLEDLLTSAYNISNRNGENTHWDRFSSQLFINGIRHVTAKTFKILPSDTAPPPAQIPSEVKAYIERLEKALKRAKESVDNFTGGINASDDDFDCETCIAKALHSKPNCLKD